MVILWQCPQVLVLKSLNLEHCDILSYKLYLLLMRQYVPENDLHHLPTHSQSFIGLWVGGRWISVFFSFSFLTSFNLWIKHMILKVIQRLLEVNRETHCEPGRDSQDPCVWLTGGYKQKEKWNLVAGKPLDRESFSSSLWPSHRHWVTRRSWEKRHENIRLTASVK